MKYLFFSFLLIQLLLFSCANQPESSEVVVEDTVAVIEEAASLFGIESDSFVVETENIKANQFLSDILLSYNVPYATIHKIAMQSKEIFDVRRLERGKKYTVFCTEDSILEGKIFVYQPNEVDYVVYDFRNDSVLIYTGQKPINIVEREVTGTIKTSLYEALQDEDQNVMLAFEMANIFAWTIDFYRLQKGDYFKVIFNEMEVDGNFIGIDRVLAIRFNHEDRDFYAYHYVQDSTGADYFDESAQSLRKTFLKSPLKFSRLTSGYTSRRFHPVQKRWKAHLGTDYAAPRGTPILSTGDGTVVEAAYKKYNGNYVKIKHNSMYMTQYLHMNKIAEGIKPGKYVKQGEVIGYVGSTGLATGPHVCYRFWKFGQQVNHLKEEFPPSEPVREENMADYYDHVLQFQDRLKTSS